MPTSLTNSSQLTQPAVQIFNEQQYLDVGIQLPRCSACLGLAFNAWRTPHNCLLCGSCRRRHLGCQEAEFPCPGRLPSCVGRMVSRWSDWRQDGLARQQLSTFLIHCPNLIFGCSFVGEFRTLLDHVTHRCARRWIRCTRCDMMLRWAGLLRHQSSDECRQFIFDNFGSYDGVEVSLKSAA